MRTKITAAAASAVALAVFGAAGVAGAQSSAADNLTMRNGSQNLSFAYTPVSDVVAQFHRTFGGNMVIKPGLSTDRLVSFSVDNIHEPGAAIETVQDLANALGADWQKTFLISRATSDDESSTPLIDSDAPVVLKSTEMPARDAIELVASVDGATTQFYSTVSGTVHFSSTSLTAPQAAREIANQTHTKWKALYVLAPRLGRSVPLGAKIIGRTAGGRPILELPSTTFRTPPPEPVVTAPNTTASAPDTSGSAIAGDNAPGAQSVPMQPAYPYGYMNPYAYTPYGYPGYGYPAYGYPSNPYGYAPGYGYNPYGYSPGFVGNGLEVLPTAPVYAPPIVFGG